MTPLPPSRHVVQTYEALKEEITCPICFDTLKNAIQTCCCDNLICHSCYCSIWKSSGFDEPCCPYCGSSEFECEHNQPIKKMIEKIEEFFETYSPSKEDYAEYEWKKEAARKKREEERRKEEERKKREEERKKREEERKKREEERKKREEEMKKREERKRREAELKQMREEAEREKKEKEEKEKRAREKGTSGIFWGCQQIGEELLSCFSFKNLKHLCILEAGSFIAVNEEGSCIWSGLPEGRLRSLLSGRGRRMTTKVKLIAATQNQNHIYYYIQFEDGKEYWDSYLPTDVVEFIEMHHLVSITLGTTTRGEVQYVIESMGSVLHYVPGLPNKNWLHGFDFCSLGPEGRYFVRHGNNVLYSHLPRNQYREARRLQANGRLRRMFFGERGTTTLMMVHS